MYEFGANTSFSPYGRSGVQQYASSSGAQDLFGKAMGAVPGLNLTPELFKIGGNFLKMFGVGQSPQEKMLAYQLDRMKATQGTRDQGIAGLDQFAKGKDVLDPNQYASQFYRLMMPKTNAYASAMANEYGIGQPNATSAFYQMMQDKLAEKQYDLSTLNATTKYGAMMDANRLKSAYMG
jgi:hypothetical protein